MCSESVQSVFGVCLECVQSLFKIEVISSPSASSVQFLDLFICVPICAAYFFICAKSLKFSCSRCSGPIMRASAGSNCASVFNLIGDCLGGYVPYLIFSFLK